MSPGRMSLGSLRMAPSRTVVSCQGCRALGVDHVTAEQPLREASSAPLALQTLQQRAIGIRLVSATGHNRNRGGGSVTGRAASRHPARNYLQLLDDLGNNARADGLRLSTSHFAPGERRVFGPVSLLPGPAIHVQVDWQATLPGGYETVTGKVPATPVPVMEKDK